MKKKLLMGLLAVVMCFALVGCGQEKTNNGGTNNTDGEFQGDTNGANALENVTESNYAKLAKSIFGIEIKEFDGWTLKEAVSPNKVNNLRLSYDAENAEEAITVINYYFDACLSISTDGVYSYEYTENYSLVKKDKYTDFNTYYDKEVTKINEFASTIWIYDNNNKNIQFAITVDENSVEISFTLLG